MDLSGRAAESSRSLTGAAGEPGVRLSRRVMTRAALVALAAWFTATTSAEADPRWWWSDQRLTNTPAESITPHIAALGYGPQVPPRTIFVTWSEVDPAEGDLEVWLTASFDGGCTFCASARLTDNAVNDTHPRVSVVGLPSGFISLAVAFEQSDKVVVAWDSSTLDYSVAAADLCGEFADLGPAIIAGSEYVVFGEPGSIADEPDITTAYYWTFAHFHLVWHDTRAGEDDIFYAHDLTAFGGAGWFIDPAKNLTSGSPPGPVAVRPAITADLLTDPDPTSGTPTADRTGVNVVFVDVGVVSGDGLMGLRSVDNGATFSPSGLRIDQPAADVADAPLLDRRRRPAIDTAWSPANFTGSVWVATAWDQLRDGSSAPDIRLDARYLDSPATSAPDWQAPDEPVASASAADEGGVAIALPMQSGRPDVSVLTFWEDTRFGSREIAGRGGWLDASAGNVIDPGRPAYGPVRPLDAVLSADVQMTHCAFDPATFACNTTRAAGTARDVETVADFWATYIVWSDTRDGQSEIYFKRTDGRVTMDAARLAAGCSAPAVAHVDATFDVVASCPTPLAGERMERYLVYYGTDPGGPFLNAANPVVFDHDALVGPTVTVRFDGLLPATSYSVIVVPEDEARNVYPDAFDPGLDLPAAQVNEVVITTPGPCVVGAEVCLYRSDVTVTDPYTPPRGAVYLVPATAEGISLRGLPYQCPIATGDLERDAVAITNGVPLILYQVNLPVATLKLYRSGTTIRFEF